MTELCDENGNPLDKQWEMSYDGKYRKGYIVKRWKDEEGNDIAQYESGMIRNLNTHHIIKSVDIPYFNKDNAEDMRRIYKENTANKIREEISRAMFGKEIKHQSSESVGIVAGQLWLEIVMNKNALPRDRLNAWMTIGRHAGLLNDLREAEQPVEGVKVELGVDLARDIVNKLMKNE
jgi:hypothetical protein